MATTVAEPSVSVSAGIAGPNPQQFLSSGNDAGRSGQANESAMVQLRMTLAR